MSGCCKSRDLAIEKVSVEERIRAFLMTPSPWMHWLLRILYVLIVLFALLGLSKHVFK